MKLPDKLDRIAKMEIKAPSFKRSKSGEKPAPERQSASADSGAGNGAGGRLSTFKRPGRPSLRRKDAAAGAAAGATSAAGSTKAAARSSRAKPESPKLPGPVNDLYRDLRDRHLLIPVALLLIALVAVPVLLSRSAEPAPPVPPAPDLASADAIAPAVVVDDVGVRDYRKRLDALKRSNPFESPNLNLDQATDDAAATGSTTDPGGTDLPPTDSGSSLPATDPGTLPTDPGVTDPGTVPPSDDGSGDTGDDEPEPADPIIRYIDQVVTHEVDASAGLAGNGPLTKQFKDLGSLEPVPSKTNSTAFFLGVDEGGTKAAFLLSRGSTIAVNDGGDCYPSPTECSVVYLEQGESVRLDFQKPNQQVATPYKIKVTRIAEKRTRVRD